MTAKQHFCNLAELLATSPAAWRNRHRETIETSDGAAIDAHEMRMFQGVRPGGFAKFESTDLIAKFQPRENARVGQFLQASKNRRLIETQRPQRVDDLCVAHRSPLLGQMLEYGNASGCRPQARFAQQHLCFGDGGFDFHGRHKFVFGYGRRSAS